MPENKELKAPATPSVNPPVTLKSKDVVPELPKSVGKRKSKTKSPRPGATVPKVPPSPPPPTVVPQLPPDQDPEDAPDGNVLDMLFNRSIRNLSSTKPANDPGIAMVQAIAHQIQTGKPVKDIDNVLVPHLGEMQSKIHLMLNALNYHNMLERGALYTLARWTLEKSLWDDLMQQKMNPTEKLALLQLAIKESDKVTSSITDFQGNLEKGNKGTTADIESASERADRNITKAVDPTLKELIGTSPVGRELARRLTAKAARVGEGLVNDAIKSKSKK